MTHGIRTVGVVGLGTMGAGIAQVVAHHGYEVVACEVSADLVQAGLARIGSGFGRHVERGRMTAEEREGALARVAGTTDLDAFAACDLVVEAIVEDMDAKRELFARLEGICRPDAILATNTSALSITEIAAATSTAERVVGMHFFNPAPVLPLVEVIVGDSTSATVAERVREFAEAIGKRPVVCPDRPGFVVNRILIPLLNDCVRLYEQGGISADDLDQAMTAGLNWPIGPLRLIDLIGADVHVHASEALWQAYREPRFAPPPSLVRMVESGRLGRKAGAGFYTLTDLAGHGDPNQVVSASRNPVSVPSPTQATWPSGRISTAVGAATSPSTGSSHGAGVLGVDELDAVRPRRDVEAAGLAEVEQHRPGVVQQREDARSGRRRCRRSRSGMRRPSSGCPSPRS